jgi:CBS domain-containing protein
MHVSTLIGDSVIFVAPDATLVAVADGLTTNDIGALAVGDGERPSGIISERDIVHALAARRPPETTRAIDIANTDLIWCEASATVPQVAAEMMERYVRHVLVEEKGRLVGIVSARDLLGAYAATDAPVEVE